MNTRAAKSLAFGTGLLQEQAVGETAQFLIQARNDNAENRQSGRDTFQVYIRTDDESNEEIQSDLVDQNDGSYMVNYKVERECAVKINIKFKDDKGRMVDVRGGPYTASFSAATPANTNTLTGPSL